MLKAYCASCGLLFPSAFNSMFGAGSTVNMRGNLETCPRCGAIALTEDGSFEIPQDARLKAEIMQLLGYHWVTPARLANLVQIYAQIAAHQITENEALKEAEKIGPEARIALKDLLNMAPAYVSALFAALAFFLAYYQGQASNEEVERMAARAVNEAMMQVQQNGVLQASPQPEEGITQQGSDQHSKPENGGDRPPRKPPI